MRLFVLLAVGVALTHAAPQNAVEVDSSKQQVEAARDRGDRRALLAGFMSDDATVKICSDVSCEFMKVSDAKKMEAQAIESVEAMKGDSEVVRTLSPTLAVMSESLRSLQAQKQLLENLEASMEAMRSQSNKGQALAAAANSQFAERMTKGVMFTESKGPQYAPLPASKGPMMAAALPPSKGMSYASGMNAEAMLCPMTMFELGKCQKLAGEVKLQMEASGAMNAQLMAEKQRLENQLAVSEMMRKKAEEQSAFNAKYAAEQKATAEALASRLNTCTAEKNMVENQKAAVEADLESTRADLSTERNKNAECNAALAQCNSNNEELTASLKEQTERAEAAEEELASTKALLEEERRKTTSLEESLSISETKRERCENDLQRERTTREETEAELVKTMTDLAAQKSENAMLNADLANLRDEHQKTQTALARETAARQKTQQTLDETTQQLRNTEQELRNTQTQLEDEQFAHATTRRILAETREQLETTEAARSALEEANKQLQDELTETKDQLERTTAEKEQLQVALNETTAALEKCLAEKNKCDADLATQTSISEQLTKQLTDALALLTAEKKAREELVATIVVVQETSMKVQEEVKKLQLENLQLQQQVQKLQAEQNTALALAAGCPPTYEKFGSSCYKYVREKTPWKMAQEQCMKDSGNLVAIESTQEQIFVTNYLKRLEASDAYTFTSGNKQYNGWKWLGAADNHMGASGVEFWYNMVTKNKPGYDCQAMYMYDQSNYGKWVGLPCHSSAPYVCEYRLIPHGQVAPSNPAEKMAILKMAAEAPAYLSAMARQ